MAFVVKAEVRDPRAKTFAFIAQKTMYGGKHIAEGDTVFVFASENEGGQGLVAEGVVRSCRSTPRKPGVDRKALLKEALTEIRIDKDCWREELRPRFRPTRVTTSERPDYEWPPRTPGAARDREPALD